MKRDQIILLVCAILLAVVTIVAGWFLLVAVAERNAASERCTLAYNEVKQIYQAKVFPSPENVARVKDDQRVLEGWLGTASNLLHRGALPGGKHSPTGFKQKLQATVRALSAYPGVVQGKVVQREFHFGFDRYLGESDSLPKSEHVDRLSDQLSIIERICKELYAANIMELKAVTRDNFDDERVVQPDAAITRRTTPRRRREEPGGSPTATARLAKATTEYFSRQRFSFEFQARPEMLIEALNRLAAMELFVVVAEMEFRKTSDPLLLRSAKKESPSASGGVVVEKNPALLTHVERIVTDPQIEPPVTVKLEIDVYAFDGV